MKKLFVVLAVLVSFGMMKAYCEDIRNVPGSGNNTSIPADYGGVDVATNSFYVGLSTVPSETGPNGIGYRGFYASTTTVNNVYAQSRWTVYGAYFSTGPCGADFISIQVSSSAATQAREISRIYNSVSISTGIICGGYTTTRWPIRAYGNLFWGLDMPSGAANPYNRSDLLYYKESN